MNETVLLLHESHEERFLGVFPSAGSALAWARGEFPEEDFELSDGGLSGFETALELTEIPLFKEDK